MGSFVLALFAENYADQEEDIPAFLTTTSDQYFASLCDDLTDYYEGAAFYEEAKNL